MPTLERITFSVAGSFPISAFFLSQIFTLYSRMIGWVDFYLILQDDRMGGGFYLVLQDDGTGILPCIPG